MRKFIVKLLIFGILVVVCDFALGMIIKLYDYTNRGEIHKMHRLMTEEAPELVILGSSRASHHYDPEALGDSLNVSVFNAGFDGKGLIVGYGLLCGISQREFPKYILCEMTPNFDLTCQKGVPLDLSYFHPYANIPAVKDLLVDFEPNEKWKLYSNGYRFNSSLMRVVPSILSANEDYLKGYLPIDSKEYIERTRGNYYNTIHPTKEKYLRKLIEEAKSHGSKIVFAISPIYGGEDISNYKDEIDIIKEYDVKVLNHLNDSSFINNKAYFRDYSHMNVDGTREYTKLIIKELQDWKQQK